MRTPGKWTAHDDTVISESGVLVGTASSRHHPIIKHRFAERAANARLFAAAPKMKEALEALLTKPSSECIQLINEALALTEEPIEVTYEHC